MKLKLVELDDSYEEDAPYLAKAKKEDSSDYSLKDLPYGPPPELLADPFLDSEGPTVIYAPGGSGKGLTAIYLIRRLLSDPRINRVGVLDYEDHEREWGYRSRAMGYSDEELDRVKYLAPFGKKWGYDLGPPGALINVADEIRGWVKTHGISYLVVDSYTAATTSADQLGGERSATEFFKALQVIGGPSLTLAHVAASSERFPDKPFGSVFVRNWSRRMWAMTSTQEEKTLVVEAKNTKANSSRIAQMQRATFKFYAGTISAELAPVTVKITDVLVEIFGEAEGALSVDQLVKAYELRTGENLNKDTAWRTMNRQPKVFAKAGFEKWCLNTKPDTKPDKAKSKPDNDRTNDRTSSNTK